MNLTSNEVAEYVNIHLPYRLNSLMAHDIILYRQKNKTDEWSRLTKSPYQDSIFLEPVFEASLVFGRGLMQFLGINFDKNSQPITFNPKTDDVTLKYLFSSRSYCGLSDSLLIQHSADIAILFKVANKSVAHLTSSPSNDQEHNHIPNARKAIYDLVLKYLPELPKEKLWYHNEITLLSIPK